MRRQRERIGLVVAVLVGVLASGATAEVTTERSASILVFPKVIADGTRDTIIQITNTSNSMVHAHCFYVNGALTFPDLPPGPGNPPLWIEIDFDIWLTRQQPTYWVVSQGRLVNPADPVCTRLNLSCPDAGIDPGRVPPVVPDFTGELKCIEVDSSGAPLSGNHLKGEATLVTSDVCNPDTNTCVLSGGECEDTEDCTPLHDIAKYNALGVIGNDRNNQDAVLCLGGEATAECPDGAEYNACPHTWILNHIADGAASPFLNGDSSVATDITVVPCSQNFETQIPTTVKLQFSIINEFEQAFSASTSVTCWAEHQLSDINPVFGSAFVGGSTFMQTRIRPATGNQTGFMIVMDERHVGGPVNFGVDAEQQQITGPGQATTAAANLHVIGEAAGPDLIVIPAEQIQ